MTILRMRVGPAHHVLRPVNADDVNARFARIAVQNGARRADAERALVLLLTRENANESHFVFFSDSRARAGNEERHGETKRGQRQKFFHFFLPNVVISTYWGPPALASALRRPADCSPGSIWRRDQNGRCGQRCSSR